MIRLGNVIFSPENCPEKGEPFLTELDNAADAPILSRADAGEDDDAESDAKSV